MKGTQMVEVLECYDCGYRGPRHTFPMDFPDEMPEDERQKYPSQVVCCGRCQSLEVGEPPPPPGDGVTTLNLTRVPPRWQAHALRVIDTRDVGCFMFLVGNHQRLAFVVDNRCFLQSRGLYEEALLKAFIGGKISLHGWPLERLLALLAEADPVRLRAAGDPLPEPAPTTLYRGVAGRGRARRVRGLYWTGLLDEACWFALWTPLPDPAVYQIPFEASVVLAYGQGTPGDDYLVRLPPACRPQRVDLTLEEIEARKARFVSLVNNAGS
jgi:hypothetical protein